VTTSQAYNGQGVEVESTLLRARSYEGAITVIISIS
jgi:hypothetical protein